MPRPKQSVCCTRHPVGRSRRAGEPQPRRRRSGRSFSALANTRRTALTRPAACCGGAFGRRRDRRGRRRRIARPTCPRCSRGRARDRSVIRVPMRRRRGVRTVRMASRRDCGARNWSPIPGCYPTATLLALYRWPRSAAPRHIVIDAKSGITGAGRTPRVDRSSPK